MIVKNPNLNTVISDLLVFTFLLSRLNPFLSGNSVLFWTPVMFGMASILFALGRRVSVKSFDGYFVWVVLCAMFANLTRFWAEDVVSVNYTAITMLENVPVFLALYWSTKTVDDCYRVYTVYLTVTKINALCYFLTLFIGNNGEGRIGGSTNANTVGIVMAFTIWMIIYFEKDLNKKKLKIGSMCWLFLFSVLLLLSGSKKAIILILLLFFVRQLIKDKNRFFVLIRYILLAIFLLLILRYVTPVYNALGYRIWNMINFLLSQGDSSIDFSTFIRIEFIQYGFETFLKKPWIGYGVNNFHIISYRNFQREWYDTYSHCNYTEVLTSGGIIFLVLYYAIYIKGLLVKKKEILLRLFVYPMIISLLIIEVGLVSYYDAFIGFILCFVASMIKNLRLVTTV